MVWSSLACALRNSRQSWAILSIASAGMRVLMLKFCDSTSCTSTPCGVIWIFLIGNCCGCASAGCSSCFGGASRRGALLFDMFLSFQLPVAERDDTFEAVCQDIGPIGFRCAGRLVQRLFYNADDLLELLLPVRLNNWQDVRNLFAVGFFLLLREFSIGRLNLPLPVPDKMARDDQTIARHVRFTLAEQVLHPARP